jgi:two-component system repressor protein LuxO
VRELANLVRRIVVLEAGPVVTAAMLPDSPSGPRHGFPATAGGPSPAGTTPLWLQERMAIEAALAACGGSIPQAAAALEISPSTIYRKQQAWRAREAMDG